MKTKVISGFSNLLSKGGKSSINSILSYAWSNTKNPRFCRWRHTRGRGFEKSIVHPASIARSIVYISIYVLHNRRLLSREKRPMPCRFSVIVSRLYRKARSLARNFCNTRAIRISPYRAMLANFLFSFFSFFLVLMREMNGLLREECFDVHEVRFVSLIAPGRTLVWRKEIFSSHNRIFQTGWCIIFISFYWQFVKHKSR